MVEIKTIQQLFPESKEPQLKRLLAVFAHPDDESLSAGGLLIKAAQEGIETFLICLTQGEKGVIDPGLKGERLKKERAKELARAGKILGIGKIFAHDLPDGGLFSHQDKIKQILKKTVAQVKPGAVVSFDPSGATGHPDHISTSLAAKSVVNTLENKVNLLFVVLGGELRQIFKKDSQLARNWRMMPQPTHWLDNATLAEVKEKACLAHQSQKLAQARPVSLKVWYRLFDREYLHLVDLEKKYRFRFSRFETRHFKFIPSGQKTLFA